jgi:hybrid cluster-associated redox disulfide protein
VLRAEIDETMLVEEVLARYPQAAAVFKRWGLHCVGCWLADVHTIAQVAEIFNLNLRTFMRDLRKALKEESAEGIQLF